MDGFNGVTNRTKQYKKIFAEVQYLLFAAADHKNKAVHYSGFSTNRHCGPWSPYARNYLRFTAHPSQIPC